MKNLIVVAGSVNMDLTLKVEAVPEKGKTTASESLDYIPGGKGANQAIAASRLGGEVALIGKVGNDSFGKDLRSFLGMEKLDLSALSEAACPSGIAIVTVSSEGDNSIVVFGGANDEVTPDYIQQNKDLIAKATLVSSTLETPVAAVERFFSIAKAAGKITMLNAAPAAKLDEPFFKLVDYLIVNETELAFYLGAEKIIEDEKEIIAAAKKLQEKGVGTVVATLGAKGSLTVTKDKVIRTAGLKVKAVDTTAAGDCFVGALAVQLSEDVTLEKALEFANKAASLAVQRYGASSSLPYLKELS